MGEQMNDLRLEASALFTPCATEDLDFQTTEQLPDSRGIIGQDRALEAIRFGVGIGHPGFNLFALGESGCGKHSVVRQLIAERAASETVPDDYCYIHNFGDPHRPRALSLPAGTGAALGEDMDQLVEELVSLIPKALESDEYQARMRELEEEFQEQQGKAFGELQEAAQARDIRFMRTPAGFAFAPMRDGEVIDPEKFRQLSEDERAAIEKTVSELQERLDRLIREMPRWRREVRQRIKALNRDVIMSVVGQQMEELRHKYAALPQVLAHLDAVQADVVEHADQLGHRDEAQPMLANLLPGERDAESPFLNRYKVNVLVDNGEQRGAPIVHLDNPTFPNLVGRVEHRAQLGALVTDFTMIKPGALHEANGGYLILDARNLLMQPYAYEGLKRALRSRRIDIESLGQIYSVISTVSLEPERIPLQVKIVLVGERYLYYLLCQHDAEFNELFKVAADFEDAMARSPAETREYASFIATFARGEKLRALDAAAVGRVIEHASRMTDDVQKLSTRFGRIADLLREADYHAGEAGQALITAAAVQQAIDARERRHSRIRERLLESTLRGLLMIDTEGEAIGQINGLSVIMLGEHAFGHPSRLTASVHVGRGQVVDIQREIKMGGPSHSKGVLILSGYLAGRYSPEQPLALHASLAFEQTYSEVDGDSASAAELFALLSALAEVPLKQSPGRDRLDQPAWPDPAYRRRQREDRGLFRPLRPTRPQRGPGRRDTASQRHPPDAARGRGRGR
jgi:predicted ATP-dependent protease